MREGYEVFVSAKPDLVKEFVMSNPVNALFVDCLLPGVSGVDFVQDLRKKFPPQALDIVMMSGLFTDAGFVKDALRTTKAISFLKKPFDLKEAISLVKASSESVDENNGEEVLARKALYQIFSRKSVTPREKRKAIEALDFVHGFDLPFIYSLLVETGASGHLNIVNDKGDVSGVSFAEGRIVGVDIADQETQLGKLLIQAGFLLPEDLQEALNIISPKRLGERLIHANLLSPHAFLIALANQMTIRISRTVVNAELKVNFVVNEVESTVPNLDSGTLSVFLHDWIASKITEDWLKAHYAQWGSYPITKGPSYAENHDALKMPLIATLPGLLPFVLQAKTLNQVLESQKYPEESALKGLHFLLAKGILVFSQASKAIIDPNERYKSLARMAAQFEGKQKWEIVDLLVRITGVPESDPLVMEVEIQKIIGEAPGPTLMDLNSMWEKVRKIATDGIVLAKSGDKEKIREEAIRSELEIKMKMSRQLEEGRQLLAKSAFSQAFQILKSVAEHDPNVEKMKMYLIWAKLGMADTNPGKKLALLKEVEADLVEVPPEDRFDAIYSFILGLNYKVKGDFLPAKKSFEKALNLDGTMMSARRELNVISQLANKSHDVLSKDLKDIVAGFFKKR